MNFYVHGKTNNQNCLMTTFLFFLFVVISYSNGLNWKDFNFSKDILAREYEKSNNFEFSNRYAKNYLKSDSRIHNENISIEKVNYDDMKKGRLKRTNNYEQFPKRIRKDSHNDDNFTTGNKQFNYRRRGKGQRQKMNKNALRLLSDVQNSLVEGGMFPPLFNIAPTSAITVNATCGENGREEYCKLVDAYPYKSWATQCGVCDNHSIDFERQHPIQTILDNWNDDWWQSPTLHYGYKYEYVTINLDLKQVYQVFFIIIKAAISPRPASWILERSLDNITFHAWQYFGTSDTDCLHRYGLPGHTGKYVFTSDSEVICTTQFSKAMPLENGEIHISLLKNRPGAAEQTQELLNFLTARYIRIRFQGMHSTVNANNSIGWLLDTTALNKRSFYSIKFIRISGRLDCHGHADKTVDVETDNKYLIPRCLCQHNTCGSNCEKCCPLYNNRPFQIGTLRSQNACKICQCWNHSNSCVYDKVLKKEKCENCANFTTGYNCETCLEGYFRPFGSDIEQPCQKCNCNFPGATGRCSPVNGDCICRKGFKGKQCEFCSFKQIEKSCTTCFCDIRGTVPGGECEEKCQCKSYVVGKTCSECATGYFALQENHEKGCLKCFCSGVGISCSSAVLSKSSFETLDGWKITDLTRSIEAYPTIDDQSRKLIFSIYDLPNTESIYWLAPKSYNKNLLKSYGSTFSLKVSWVVIRGDTSGKPNFGPNIILIGRNGLRFGYGDQEFHSFNSDIDIYLSEKGWYEIPSNVNDITVRSKHSEYHGNSISRMQFMSVLSDIESILIRGLYHTDQVESLLERAILYSGGNHFDENDFNLVEKCICPLGYEGLSCERCAFGYVREYKNLSSYDTFEKCVQCPCNGHAETCDIITGKCDECYHNTYGQKCEKCKVGYYGNPLQRTPEDCKRCACPLVVESNNFSPNCQLKKFISNATYFENDFEYVCTQCPPGYKGHHCEICDGGYYGNPMEIGSKCLPCPCEGGPCDLITGECITCAGNTEGWRCEKCKPGFWGDSSMGCQPCDCYDEGAENNICNTVTGQCSCKEKFGGEKCDKCSIGYADIDLKCLPCECNMNGSLDVSCDSKDGQCFCKPGVRGIKCDQCQEGFFGFSINGCKSDPQTAI